MPLFGPPKGAENRDTLGCLELLPESEVDPANITMDNPYHIKMLAYQGRSLPAMKTTDGKTRFVSAINGRSISKVDPRNLWIGDHGDFKGIVYFEDAPSKPVFILYGEEITHIDDFDLSEAEKIDLVLDNPIQLHVIKDGQPLLFTTESATRQEDGKLSQKKHEEKENFIREVSRKIERFYIPMPAFYSNQEELTVKIKGAIDELTQEELTTIKDQNIGIWFTANEGITNDFDGGIWIYMTLPAAEMAAEIKKLIREYATAKGRPMPPEGAVNPVLDQDKQRRGIDSKLQNMASFAGVNRISLSPTKLKDYNALSENLGKLENALWGLSPEEKKELNDEGLEIVICDKGMASVWAFSKTIKISYDETEENILNMIRTDLASYLKNKPQTPPASPIVFDPPRPAVPRIGTAEDDDSGIIFDPPSGDKTPPEGIDISAMELGEEPRPFTEPVTSHIDLVSFHDGTQGVERGDQRYLPAVVDNGPPTRTTKSSPRDEPIDFDKLLRDAVAAGPGPRMPAEPVSQASPQPSARTRSTTPASVRQHLESPEPSMARMRINLLPNEKQKIQIRDVPNVVIEAVMSRVGKIMDSLADRLDGKPLKPKTAKPALKAKPIATQKQKNPGAIRGFMNNRALRLLVGGTLVGGAMVGGVKLANRAPIVQNLPVPKFPTLGDVEKKVNKIFWEKETPSTPATQAPKQVAKEQPSVPAKQAKTQPVTPEQQPVVQAPQPVAQAPQQVAQAPMVQRSVAKKLAPAKAPAKAVSKAIPKVIRRGMVIVPASKADAEKRGLIIVTTEGKTKPATGWKWTYLSVSKFSENDPRRFSVTKE